jgi:hypothetical protein
MKLLGFQDASTLKFEHNVKHSHFIYPDDSVRPLLPFLCPLPSLVLPWRIETAPDDWSPWRSGELQQYAGSTRTFAALLRSTLNAGKIGIARCIFRRGTGMVICAMLPQARLETSPLLHRDLAISLLACKHADIGEADLLPFAVLVGSVQEETFTSSGGQDKAPGFHLIQFPFVDDMREPPVKIQEAEGRPVLKCSSHSPFLFCPPAHISDMV